MQRHSYDITSSTIKMPQMERKGYRMRKILAFMLILALMLAILPAGARAEDDAPAQTAPPSEAPASPDASVPPQTPASNPAPQATEEPTPSPSSAPIPDATPTPEPSPAPVYDIEKARQEYRNTLEGIKGTGKFAAARTQGEKPVQTLAAAEGKKRFYISFKAGTPFQQMQASLANTVNKMIGSPDNGKYVAVLDDPAAFRQAYGDIIQSMDEDKVIKIADIPNDTLYHNQYALPLMNVPDAWDISKGSDAVKVAVIDTGIYRAHPDFAGTSITPGYDVITRKSGVDQDPYGHGTTVAGVIAATANNGKGISGVCWDVTIEPYRVADSNGNIYVSDMITAVYMAVDSGCKVINLSMGGPDTAPGESTAIKYAIDHGCIVVASAGNEATEGNPYEYPASLDDVISAASINSSCTHSYFSNYNDKVDICAPGEDIYTTSKSGGYCTADGTSYSAPYVSGIAALAASMDPHITASGFNDLLEATSRDLGTPGRDNSYGYGLIDAEAILIRLAGGADLSHITVSTGTLSPAFKPATTSYQLRLGTQGSVTITPARSDPDAGMTINGQAVASITSALNYGESRAVSITVTAVSGTSKTYTITITRPYPNGYLSNIALSTQRLSPAFNLFTTNYRVDLPEGTPSVTITPVRTNPSNKMTIDGRKATSKKISLSPGKGTTVKIAVYETSRIKHTYSVYAARARSTDATLSRMSVSGGTPDSPFANGTPVYTVTVPETRSSATIRLYRNSSYATAYIDNRKATSKTVSIANGQTKTVTVRVRAQAGNERQFQIRFVRPARISSFSASPAYQRIPSLSPQGSNTLKFQYRLYGSAETRIEIFKDGAWKRILARAEGQGSKTYTWDGRVEGQYLAPGTYSAKVYTVYNGAYTSQPKTLSVRIYGAPAIATTLSTMELAKGKKLSALISWNVPTNITVQVINQNGSPVATLYSGTNRLPASKAVYWTGKTGLTYAAPGTYRIRITAGGTIRETGSFTLIP